MRAMQTPWAEPFDRFRELFEQAKASQPKDPNTVFLGTADARGRPSVRPVLLKDFDEQGFVFYTNYESRKGKELEENPQAALTFYWPSLDQQVRIEGPVEKVSAEESDAYFKTRHRTSRIGAWASDQSRPVASRLDLDARVAKLGLKYAVGDIPRPPHWGGYRVKPERIEFWKAHPFRLHWREQYDAADGAWNKTMLFP